MARDEFASCSSCLIPGQSQQQYQGKTLCVPCNNQALHYRDILASSIAFRNFVTLATSFLNQFRLNLKPCEIKLTKKFSRSIVDNVVSGAHTFEYVKLNCSVLFVIIYSTHEQVAGKKMGTLVDDDAVEVKFISEELLPRLALRRCLSFFLKDKSCLLHLSHTSHCSWFATGKFEPFPHFCQCTCMQRANLNCSLPPKLRRCGGTLRTESAKDKFTSNQQPLPLMSFQLRSRRRDDRRHARRRHCSVSGTTQKERRRGKLKRFEECCCCCDKKWQEIRNPKF